MSMQAINIQPPTPPDAVTQGYVPKHLRPRAIKKRAKRLAKIQAKKPIKTYDDESPSAGNYWD